MVSQKKLDSVYYEILKKCAASSENANLLLEQQSIKFLLTEKLDASDLKEVTDSLAKTRKSLVKLRTYADQLQMKTELQLMYDYIDSLEEALDKAQKQLADVSFDTGKLSGFFGKKISLPEITSASVKLGQRLVMRLPLILIWTWIKYQQVFTIFSRRVWAEPCLKRFRTFFQKQESAKKQK